MMRKGRDRLTAAAMIWLALAGAAQAGAAGGIAGRVTESGSGAPIAGAQVVVYDADGHLDSVFATGADGRFDTGPVLPPGHKEVVPMVAAEIILSLVVI